MRVLHAMDSAAEDNPSRNDNEKKRDNFDRGNKVHPSNTQFWEECMKQRHEDDDNNRNSTLLPFGGFPVCGNHDIGSKNDTSRCCYCVSGEWRSSEHGKK